MTPDQQKAEVLAAKPVAAGPGFAGEQDRYEVLQKAVALLKNKDWEIVDNINTDSDAWQINQTALIHSYARFEFIPWDWKGTIRQVWT